MKKVLPIFIVLILLSSCIIAIHPHYTYRATTFSELTPGTYESSGDLPHPISVKIDEKDEISGEYPITVTFYTKLLENNNNLEPYFTLIGTYKHIEFEKVYNDWQDWVYFKPIGKFEFVSCDKVGIDYTAYNALFTLYYTNAKNIATDIYYNDYIPKDGTVVYLQSVDYKESLFPEWMEELKITKKI